MGETDYLLRVLARDIEDLEDLIVRIGPIQTKSQLTSANPDLDHDCAIKA